MADDLGPMEGLDRATKLLPAAAVMACRVGSDLVLLDTVNGRYFGLDEVGASIFEHAAPDRTLHDIHQALIDEYDAPADVLWQDLITFSTRLLSLQLFVRS